MSRHEGVSCDSCMKNGFTGRRYKCLRCSDYDLCSSCYDAGLVTSRHKVDHAMQCLLTRADSELYFGGEEANSLSIHHSFTCPYCGKLGLTDIGLQEHIEEDHGDETKEVVCPVCAATPGGDPNHMTEDLLSHLTVEHRSPRTAVYDDAQGDGTHNAQRSTGQNSSTDRHAAVLASIRTAGRSQLRRADVFISDSSPSGGGSSGREFEAIDPVSELLSQLTNARNRAQAVRNVSAQLHQLELQLQSTRQQLEGLPLRTVMPSATTTLRSLSSGAQKLVVLSSSHAGSGTTVVPSSTDDGNSIDGTSKTHVESKPFLLSRHKVNSLSEAELEQCEAERADRSMFVQELFLAAIALSSDRCCNSVFSSSADISSCADNSSCVVASSESVSQPSESISGETSSPVTHSAVSGGVLEDGVPDGISVSVLKDTRKEAAAAMPPSLIGNDTSDERLARLVPKKAVRETLK